MITDGDYWMGRDVAFASELTAEVRSNALDVISKTNALKRLAVLDGVTFGVPEVASGWRPAEVNDATSNAACHSHHIDGSALDTRDTRDRKFARWCLRNLDKLEEIGLWMEDPRWTPSWVHLQTVPPKSGRRVYIPSAAAPIAAPLPEQRGVTT